METQYEEIIGHHLERIKQLETALRKIRGLAFKKRKFKYAFKDAVKIASEALGVSNPISLIVGDESD